MCHSFVPIEASNGQSQNTNALIDQVVIKDGSLEAFAYSSLKQYRHDAAQKPQRQIWAIASTDLEAYLFRRDLEEVIFVTPQFYHLGPSLLSQQRQTSLLHALASSVC